MKSSLAAPLASATLAADSKQRPCILLRSSWQMVNIGDIAHTPGVLALIEKHIPEADVILWASGGHSEEVAAMEQKRFSKLKVVKGQIEGNGKASNEALADAIESADFLIHGSGPALVAKKDVEAFVEHTNKPFGVFGITRGASPDKKDHAILNKAKFVFFRDSVSLKQAKDEGINSPVMKFGPDGAFACDLRDDAKAEAFLKENGLEQGKFLCCLSRLRFTPYWTIPSKKREIDPERHEHNEKMKEHDHAALRESIIAVVPETDLKVLLCPEDMTQMAVGKEMLWDKLPNDVKERVVWRDKFWLTDEALSTYLRSAGLFGSEMHSPIMAIGNGIPAIVCRFKEQTSKGTMWRDIGLGDWLFDLDQDSDHPRIKPAVLEMAKNPSAAKEKTVKARAFVQKRQREMCEQVVRTGLLDPLVDVEVAAQESVVRAGLDIDVVDQVGAGVAVAGVVRDLFEQAEDTSARRIFRRMKPRGKNTPRSGQKAFAKRRDLRRRPNSTWLTEMPWMKAIVRPLRLNSAAETEKIA